MKITHMRTNGKELTNEEMKLVMYKIESKLSYAGFLTDVTKVSSTSIRAGQRMRSFSLDLNKHNRNLYVSRSGDKLTNLPTWDQRVDFNNIINSVLDSMNVSANIKSGPYTIRQGMNALTESDWFNQKPSWTKHNEYNGNYIKSINEKEYLEERRLKRNATAKAKRQLNKVG